MALERILTLSALVSLGCSAYCQEPAESLGLPSQATEEPTPSSPAIVSFDFATETGLELEQNYQEQLKTWPPGRHIIIVGDYGKPGGGLYIGSVEASVRRLRSNLRGTVEVWRFPGDVSSGTDILEKIENDNGALINSVHIYGHGDSSEYWLGILPSENSLTIGVLNSLGTETQEAVHSKFAPEGYIKFYGCHVAAAHDYEEDTNFARTTAEVLGIKTIGANSWVFIEVPEARYMYPVSRELYKYYFTHERPDYPVPINEHGEVIDDPLYTGESAWVTYIPFLEETIP